ncbi:hypothetical protein [Nonomuraea sp. NPDC050691]|uniref:hypothetical protein n=1 Tax=Nonomuraea sp. NPDC050691 TaxID=3155661 RepID=UPI0033C02C4B
MARRLCADPQTAEDLASEAFARTLRTVRAGTAGPEGAVASLPVRGGTQHGSRAHLESCPNCARAYGELLDLNTRLRAALPFAALPLAMGAVGKAKAASAGGLGWAIPASIASAVTVTAAVVVTTLPPDPSPPPDPRPSTAAQPTLSTSPKPKPTPTPKKKTPKSTPTPTRKPTPRAVPGTRINYAGRCVGVISGRIAAARCADARTAWRTKGDPGRFQLVNNVSGLCLTAGEKYDNVAFNGGGMRAVRLSRCSDAPAQRWDSPTFSDGVPRLISVPYGMALSIGKEFVGKRPPTAFILYGAYTGSSEQRITLMSNRE